MNIHYCIRVKILMKLFWWSVWWVETVHPSTSQAATNETYSWDTSYLQISTFFIFTYTRNLRHRKHSADVQLRHLYHLLASCHEVAVLMLAKPSAQCEAAPGPRPCIEACVKGWCEDRQAVWSKSSILASLVQFRQGILLEPLISGHLEDPSGQF